MPKNVPLSVKSNVVSIRVRQPKISASKNEMTYSKQLELGLDRTRMLVLLSADALHGARFLGAISEFQPKTLMDVRYAPHFNFTGGGSELTIKSLKKIGVRYISSSIPLHQISKNFLQFNLAEIAANLVKNFDLQRAGPVMALFQHQADAKIFGPFLLGALEKADNQLWQLKDVS
jgi:hypothetical protein